MPAFLPPGTGVSQVILMEVFYSFSCCEFLHKVRDWACHRGELAACTSTLPPQNHSWETTHPIPAGWSTPLLIRQTALKIQKLETLTNFHFKNTNARNPWWCWRAFSHLLSWSPYGSSAGTMLLTEVLQSLLPPEKQFTCFHMLSDNQHSQLSHSESIHLVIWCSALQLPQCSSTPAMGKQEIPSPKTPYVTSLCQGLPPSDSAAKL